MSKTEKVPATVTARKIAMVYRGLNREEVASLTKKELRTVEYLVDGGLLKWTGATVGDLLITTF